MLQIWLQGFCHIGPGFQQGGRRCKASQPVNRRQTTLQHLTTNDARHSNGIRKLGPGLLQACCMLSLQVIRLVNRTGRCSPVDRLPDADVRAAVAARGPHQARSGSKSCWSHHASKHVCRQLQLGRTVHGG